MSTPPGAFYHPPLPLPPPKKKIAPQTRKFWGFRAKIREKGRFLAIFVDFSRFFPIIGVYFENLLFRALFQPEFRHFRSFLDVHDLALWVIFNLSHLSAVLVLLVLRKLNRRKPGRNQRAPLLHNTYVVNLCFVCFQSVKRRASDFRVLL